MDDEYNHKCIGMINKPYSIGGFLLARNKCNKISSKFIVRDTGCSRES